MTKLYFANNITSKELLNRVFDDQKIKNRELVYGKNGKPYLKSNEIYFNISHSGDQSVCAVSDREIGVDLQKITYRPAAARKVCTTEELASIKTAADFTRIWTLKESFVKANGAGLGYGLQNVNTKELQASSWRKGDYYVAVCYNGKQP